MRTDTSSQDALKRLGAPRAMPDAGAIRRRQHPPRAPVGTLEDGLRINGCRSATREQGLRRPYGLTASYKLAIATTFGAGLSCLMQFE